MPSEEPRIPERVLQIGEGRFLRGFVDWILEQLARREVYPARVVVVFPRAHEEEAKIPWMRAGGAFHVAIRGLEQGRRVDVVDTVSVVSRVLDPYREWEAFLQTAKNPSLEMIITNTTEAGLMWRDEPYPGPGRCPDTVAGKLTLWLWERYQAFDGSQESGVDLVPCELLENNGAWLRSLILRYAEAWQLPPSLSAWIQSANRFYNTLVDSIITPADPADDRVQGDSLAVTREPFYSWLLEGPPDLPARWQLPQAGLAVEVVPDLRPYRELKVRVLNGAHTAMAALGLLAGLRTVGEVMADHTFRGFLDALLLEEVAPTLVAFGLSESKVREFIAKVAERFQNPYLHHQLRDIQLQARTKVRTRLFPSLRDRWLATGEVPRRLTVAVVAQTLWMLREEGVTDPSEERIVAQMAEWWDDPWVGDETFQAAARQWTRRLAQVQGLEDVHRVLTEAL
ncbi:MAG: tagaturonate reductase [Firmicutes bacterium]|nr:tagaturonate reductase [Bacillota bacterium]